MCLSPHVGLGILKVSKAQTPGKGTALTISLFASTIALSTPFLTFYPNPLILFPPQRHVALYNSSSSEEKN